MTAILERGAAPSTTVGSEIINGDGVSMGAVGRRLNKNPLTIWRWGRKGVAAHDGTRVYLETAFVGKQMLTSWAAVSRFIDRLQIAPTKGDVEIDDDPEQIVRNPVERNEAAT